MSNWNQVSIDSGNGLAQKAAAINSSNDGPVHWCSYESPNFNVKIICEALYDLQILMPHQISKSVLVLLFGNISSFNAVTMNNGSIIAWLIVNVVDWAIFLMIDMFMNSIQLIKYWFDWLSSQFLFMIYSLTSNVPGPPFNNMV